jgi:hypothetical protein
VPARYLAAEPECLLAARAHQRLEGQRSRQGRDTVAHLLEIAAARRPEPGREVQAVQAKPTPARWLVGEPLQREDGVLDLRQEDTEVAPLGVGERHRRGGI